MTKYKTCHHKKIQSRTCHPYTHLSSGLCHFLGVACSQLSNFRRWLVQESSSFLYCCTLGDLGVARRLNHPVFQSGHYLTGNIQKRLFLQWLACQSSFNFLSNDLIGCDKLFRYIVLLSYPSVGFLANGT